MGRALERVRIGNAASQREPRLYRSRSTPEQRGVSCQPQGTIFAGPCVQH